MDYVNLLYYKCHKIYPNCGGSYIDSSNSIKNNKSLKKCNKCFQYAVTVALKNEGIKHDPQMITKTKSFINMIGKNLRKIR